MYFDKPVYITEYIGAFYYERRPYRFSTPARDFSVISLRFCGNTDFKTPYESITVNSKDILFIPKNTPYTQTDNTEEELISIHFNSDYPLSDSIAVIGTADKRVEDMFRKLAFLTQKSTERNRYESISILYTLLGYLMRKEQDEKNTSDYPAVLTAAIQLFSENYSDCALNVSAAADILGVSASYLRRLFADYCKITVSEFLRKIRMEHANVLLKSGYYHVYEVAERCGYSDVKTFSTAYRRETGCSPSSQLGRTSP